MEELRKNTQKFDLVLLDLVMPELDGFEVMNMMSDDESLSHIIIIVMSANDSNETISDCLKLGAVNFFHKPIKKN